MPFVTNHGHAHPFLTIGNGPPLVMHHGTFGSGAASFACRCFPIATLPMFGRSDLFDYSPDRQLRPRFDHPSRRDLEMIRAGGAQTNFVRQRASRQPSGTPAMRMPSQMRWRAVRKTGWLLGAFNW